MTNGEKKTLSDLYLKFNNYVKKDMEWKLAFENKLAPILKEREDSDIVKKWWKTVFHFIAVIVGFLVSVSILIHYILAPSLKK